MSDPTDPTDPTRRALRLLALLQQRAAWPGETLAQRLGVTTRTLRRDIARLRALGYVVESEPGNDGGYALGHGTIVPPLLLDADEAVSVSVALAVGTASGTAGDPEAAARALTKIDAALPTAVRERARGVRAALHVRPFDAGPDAGVLTLALDAVRRRQRLRFGYTAATGQASQRWVEPVRVVARGGRWYVWAWDVDRRDWRSFRLDRMESVEQSDWEFRPRPDLAEGLARLDAPMAWEAHAHRVEVVVRGSAADVGRHLGVVYGDLADLGDGRVRYATGVDDPGEAAAWLAWLPFDFVIEGDEAVVSAVAALGRRMTDAARAADAGVSARVVSVGQGEQVVEVGVVEQMDEREGEVPAEGGQ